ncbi:hypothetical protein C0992_000183, partial [Termitomyces sp. T32_za158]
MISNSDELDGFKRSLAAFAFTPSSKNSETSSGSSGLGLSKKRTFQSSDVPQVCDKQIDKDGLQVRGSNSGPPSKKKRIRGYADPEVYAHLQGLPDILSEGLD